MKQTEEQKQILDSLLEFAVTNHRSLASIAKQIGVTQNTISNWKKGSQISPRILEKILNLIGNEAVAETCCTNGCACRNTDNPIIASLLAVLGDLQERDIAKLYAFALELRDSQGQYRYISLQGMNAAEDSAPYNKY